jgi:hypothetical protein
VSPEDERELRELADAIKADAGGGVVSMHLSALAAMQWDPYRGARDDWPAIYNAWLLFGEEYRLESQWHGTLAVAGPRGRRGSPVRLLRYACFGIWCELWDVPALVASARRWCELELAAMRGPMGPSASVVDCFLAGKPKVGAAIEWAAVRRNFSRGGLKRDAVHNDSYPFDVLAPELAWCARAGQTVPRLTTTITTFPPRQEWPITPVTEAALMAVGSSSYA